jgi:beta-lactamase class A
LRQAIYNPGMDPVRKTYGLLAALWLASMAGGQSAKRSEGLKKQLDAIAQATQGTFGYSLHHLKTGDRLERLGDELFPTDSTLKVAIMAAGMEPIISGQISYTSTRRLHPDDRNAGGFFFTFRDNTEIEFKEAIHQMIAHSDNTATLMLLRWIGGTDPVNDWLQRRGLGKTRLTVQYPISPELERNEAKLEELKRDVAKWGMGVSTPNEMRQLMEMIVDGRAGSPAAADEMWRILTHQYFDGGIGSQIPPGVSVASKSGRGARTRSGMAIVNSPSGIYVLVIFAQGGSDARSSWHDHVATSIRSISRAVWQHYHPTDKWSPPVGAEKLW